MEPNGRGRAWPLRSISGQRRADLFSLYDFIAAHSGRRRRGHYIDRIEAGCQRLASFPERGTQRDDLAPGLRIIGFERRATIVFRIEPNSVEIVRGLYSGRSIPRAVLEE